MSKLKRDIITSPQQVFFVTEDVMRIVIKYFKQIVPMVCRAVLWCAELYCHPPRPQAADGGAASRYRG